MQSNYPDYKRISEIENELQDIRRKQESARYYNEKAYDKETQLEEELKKLIMGEPVEVVGKSCNMQDCGRGNYRVVHHPVYYPGKVHHLNGDTNNESFGNLAMVCPQCRAHILLSRFSPEDIWLLKAKSLNNAQIGRLLGISRERVRQLCKRYETQLSRMPQIDIDSLVKEAQARQRELVEYGKLGRLTDKRTLRKRIKAEMDRMAKEKQREAQNERTHS